MMDYFSKYKNALDHGRKGYNVGIPIANGKLKRYIPNIQKKKYYLVGALSKVGKTSFVDDVFVFNAILHHYNNQNLYDLHIDYVSLEIDDVSKLINFGIYLLYRMYGVSANYNEILSFGDLKILDEDYKKLMELENIIKYLTKVLHFHTDSDYKNIDELFKKIEENDGKLKRDSKKNNQYHLVVWDHIGLTGDKSTIDYVSQYSAKVHRNKYEMTPIVVQQFSFDSESTDRRNSTSTLSLLPTMRDFGDSKYTTRDADIVMGLLNPFYYNVTKPFFGYDVTKFHGFYRCLTIIGNRSGGGLANIHYLFLGNSKVFLELPTPEKLIGDWSYENIETTLKKRKLIE